MSAHLGQALNAFVDGELDAAHEDEVLAHLAWCGGCREEVPTLDAEVPTLPRSGTTSANEDR